MEIINPDADPSIVTVSTGDKTFVVFPWCEVPRGLSVADTEKWRSLAHQIGRAIQRVGGRDVYRKYQADPLNRVCFKLTPESLIIESAIRGLAALVGESHRGHHRRERADKTVRGNMEARRKSFTEGNGGNLFTSPFDC